MFSMGELCGWPPRVDAAKIDQNPNDKKNDVALNCNSEMAGADNEKEVSKKKGPKIGFRDRKVRFSYESENET
jgi:hypothetical protein